MALLFSLSAILRSDQFDDASDRFGMRLRYQDASLPANRRCYNGNIARIDWKVAGAGLPNTNVQTYDYSYDGLSRLTSATYTAPGKDHHFNANFDYDLNGNILALQRWMNSTLTDDLDYDYERGNRLSRVTDHAQHTAGFHDGNTAGGDYLYDGNGSMVKDRNKAIDTIYYNHLNLPRGVRYLNGDSIAYLYDAAGVKLQQKVYKSGTLFKKTDYVGEFIYQNETLQLIQHEEGRIVLKNGGFDYQYHFKDHLGNVRVTVDESGDVVQSDDYYPFGLTFNSYSRTASTPQKFLLSGNEKLDEWGIGVYDFNARMYESTIGRFMSVDPLADERSSINPYNYVQNNPISRVDPSGLLDEWIPEVQDDGSVQYIAEEGDNLATFAEQYNLSDEQARAIFDQNGYQTAVLDQPNTPQVQTGDAISGESVENVTGSEVLKLDWQSNVTNDSKRIDQILFAMEYSKSEQQFSPGDFLQNIPYHHDGDTYGFGPAAYLHGTTTKLGNGPTKIDMMFAHRSKLPISTYSDAADNYFSKGGSYTFRFDNATSSSYPSEAMFIRFKGAENMKNFTQKMGFPFSGRSKTFSPLKK